MNDVGGRLLRRLAPVFLFALFFGCIPPLLTGCSASLFGEREDEDDDEEDKISREPIIFPNPRRGKGVREGATRDKRPVDEEHRGWAEKFELAARYAQGGYDDEAIKILDVCLARMPDEPWASKMRELKSQLTTRRAEERLLRVDARGVKDYVAFGDTIDFRVRLRNVSDEAILLKNPRDPKEGFSSTALSLDVKRTDRDIYATQMARRWTVNVPLYKAAGEVIKIPPNGIHEVRVRIPRRDAGGPLSGMREIRLGGMLRPTLLNKGGRRRTVHLRVRSGRVVALPEGFEPLAEQPLESMRASLRSLAPTHLLVACEFVPTSGRMEAMEILARALEEGDPSLHRAALGGIAVLRERMQGAPLKKVARPLVEALERTSTRDAALMDGLAMLSDRRFAPDKRLWLDWFERELSDRAPVPSLED